MKSLHIPSKSRDTHLFWFVASAAMGLLLAYVAYASFEKEGITLFNLIFLFIPPIFIFVAKPHFERLQNFSPEDGITINNQGLFFKGIIKAPVSFVPWENIASFTTHSIRTKYYKATFLRLILGDANELSHQVTSGNTAILASAPYYDFSLNFIDETPEEVLRKIMNFHNEFVNTKKPNS